MRSVAAVAVAVAPAPGPGSGHSGGRGGGPHWCLEYMYLYFPSTKMEYMEYVFTL